MSDPRARELVERAFEADYRRRRELARLPIERKIAILIELQKTVSEIAVAAGRPPKEVWPPEAVPRTTMSVPWAAVRGEAWMRNLFPEAAVETLNWETQSSAIALRIVERGGVEAIRWIRSAMNDATLRRLIEERKGRGIEPQRLRLWQLLLDIPGDDVSVWLAAPERRIWEKRSA